MKRLILLLTLLPLLVRAQDDVDDYYAPETVQQPTMSLEDAKRLYRWGPKLGIETHLAASYCHLQQPASLMGAFDKSAGGFGMDAGIGLRVRIYHKLAMAGGFNFAIRNYGLGYEGTDGDSINPQIFEVDERATLFLMGFYQKTIIELSRKLHLAQTFQYVWMNRYVGRAQIDNTTTPGAFTGTLDLDGPLPDGWRAPNGIAELGLELAYKMHLAPELIIKPYFALGLGLTPAVHTGLFLPSLLGEREQNPRFINFRLGVVFETGLWTDRPKMARTGR